MLANFSWSYLRYQLFVILNFEHAQIIKIRIFVSLRTTGTTESTLEECNTGQICLFMVRNAYNLISCWFSFSLEVIVKGQDLGSIPEPKSF